MSFTVTVTQTAGTSPGTGLQVVVLTGLNGTVGRTGSAENGTGTLAITPLASGSLIYVASHTNNGVGTPPTANAATTLETGSPFQAGGNFLYFARSSATTTSGTPVTVGALNVSFCDIVAAEIEKSTTLAEDASSPALVSNPSAILVTTAAFSPPGNALLVALVSTQSGGATTVAITDTSGTGMTWTQQVSRSTSSFAYDGIWTARVPAPVDSGPFTITLPGSHVAVTGKLTHSGGFTVTMPGPAHVTLAGKLTHSGGFTITLPKVKLGFHTGIVTIPETVTCAQHSNHGAAVQVLVFTGTAASPVGATATASAAQTCTITPAATGSVIAGNQQAHNTTVPAANAATTFLPGSPFSGYIIGPEIWFMCRSAATTTAGTPVALGTTAVTGTFALAEIKPATPGSLAIDASSPPLVSNTALSPGTLTTAQFFPPGRAVLVLLLTGGDTGAPAPTITDTRALTWTLAVTGANQFIYASSPLPVTAFGDFTISLGNPRTALHGFSAPVRGHATVTVTGATGTSSVSEKTHTTSTVTEKTSSSSSVT